jgi:hypothetical protein
MVQPNSAIEKLGINLLPVHCPQCDERMPVLRIPDIKQLAFGGWTCSKWGCRMDKWDRALAQPQGK